MYIYDDDMHRQYNKLDNIKDVVQIIIKTSNRPKHYKSALQIAEWELLCNLGTQWQYISYYAVLALLIKEICNE